MNSKPRLYKHLIAIGLACSRRGEDGRLRFWALVAAACASTIILTLVVGTFAVYEGRQSREHGRTLTLADDRDSAAAMWRIQTHTTGRIAHEVEEIEPLRKTLPPLGLLRWPSPGEVFLSPALLEWGADEQIAQRYGRYAGTIAPEGLASPAERLAIVRPRTTPSPDDKSWQPVRAYGDHSGAGTGYFPIAEMASAPPISQILAIILTPLVASVAVLIAIASRIGSRARDRRLGLLSALGAGRSHRTVFNLAEAAVPITAGSLLGLAPYAIAALSGIQVPFTTYSIFPADLRSYLLLATSTAPAAIIVLSIAVTTLNIIRPLRSTRPGTQRLGTPKWRGALFLSAIGLIGISQYLSGPVALLSLLSGLILTWWMIPSVVTLAIGGLGDRIARYGMRKGSAPTIISGRWLTAHSGPIIRTAVAMVVGIGLVTQVQVWGSRMGGPSTSAEILNKQVGDDILKVNASKLTPERISAFQHALPPGYEALKVFVLPGKTQDHADKTVVQGSCKALKRLHVSCEPRPGIWKAPETDQLAEIKRNFITEGSDSPTIGLDGQWPARTASHLSILAPESGKVAIWQMKEIAYRLLTGGTSTIGEIWIVGAEDQSQGQRWITLFGVLGVLILLIASGFSALAEYSNLGRRLAPIVALTGSRVIYWKVAALSLTVSMLCVSIAGTILATWQGVFTANALPDATLLPGTLIAGFGAAACAAVLTGIAGGYLMQKRAQTWRPIADK